MLKHLADERLFVEITGFKNVEADKPDQLLKALRGGIQTKVVAQFFNANIVATWRHLYFAVLDALMAFKTKRNISRNLAVEVMLYASAQRQIKKAIDIIGVKNGCSDIAVVVIGGSRGAVESVVTSISGHFHREPDDPVLDLSPSKTQAIRQVFRITEAELNVVAKQNDMERALVDLVVERMALLSTRL